MRQRVLLFTLILLGISGAAIAQPDSKGIRSAADAKKFRVIKRIPSKEPTSLLLAPTKSPYSKVVMDHVRAREFEEAWNGLKTQKPAAAPYDFLYGYVALRAAQKTEDKKIAARAASILREGKSTVLQDYYDFYSAVAAFEAGDFEEAASLVSKIPKTSSHFVKGSFLLARALYRLGDIVRAERAHSSLIATHPKEIARAETQKVAAEVFLEKKSWDNAARHLRSNVVDFPGTSYETDAEAAFEGFKIELSKAARLHFEKRTAEEALAIYETLFSKHASERVVKELPTHFSKFKNTDDRCRAEFLVAKSWTKLRKHPEAIKAYEPLIKKCRDGKVYLKSLYQLGRSYWNSGKPKSALKAFKRLEKEFPKHSYADDAVNYQARILLELGRKAEAEKALQRQLKKYPDGDMAADARWLLFRTKFAAKKYDAAIKFAKSQPADDKNDLYSAGRLLYFSGRAQSLSGKKKDARATYLELIKEYPLGYYALLAVNRVAEIDGVKTSDVCEKSCTFFASSFPEIKIPESIKTNPSFSRGKTLRTLGLSSLAEKEFLALRKNVAKSEYWGLARVLHQSNVFPFSHDLARRHLGEWEQTYPSEDVRWQISYPTPFTDSVKKASKSHGIESAIIYAIMREESGFNPTVKSWAGAYGLMQLMPGTARTTSRKAGISYAGASTLYDPDVAIDVGTAYLAELALDANNHPALIIGGYNGGWGNMGRWLKELPSSDLDLWVEDITYGQTRNYTKRVLRSYWVYKWVHEGVSGPRLKMTVR